MQNAARQISQQLMEQQRQTQAEETARISVDQLAALTFKSSGLPVNEGLKGSGCMFLSRMYHASGCATEGTIKIAFFYKAIKNNSNN